MIVLDTNIVSELMRSAPHVNVATWLATQDPLQLATTSITIAEIQRGLARLPKGKRRSDLIKRFIAFAEAAFSGRLLVFDKVAAYACGEVSAARERQGLHADAVDMLIAAMVKTNDATFATRNTKDFEGCGIALINPWQEVR